MTDFYKALEDRFRGTEEDIEKRLKFYIPFLDKIKQANKDQDLKALDIGCGRGEWLKILKENNFEGLGIDINKSMVASVKSKGLNAIQSDAIDFIKSQEENKFVLVSAFHVVEHLDFEYLITLTKEILRILKPGGLLIYETPNPENLTVGTTNFWLDPTHKRPLPPLLLSFITEYCGFYRNKIFRLNGPEIKDINLSSVLFGVSLDYTIIAQKQSTKEVLEVFDESFSKNEGISLADISMQLDSTLNNVINKNEYLENVLNNVINKNEYLENVLNNVINKNEYLENVLNNVINKNEYLENVLNNVINEMNAKNTHLEHQLIEILNSDSWKITKPLRELGKFARWFKTGTIAWLTLAPNSRPRRVLKKSAIRTKDFIEKRPMLKKILKSILIRFPKLYEKAVMLKFRLNIQEVQIVQSNNVLLNKRANKIYNLLKTLRERSL